MFYWFTAIVYVLSINMHQFSDFSILEILWIDFYNCLLPPAIKNNIMLADDINFVQIDFLYPLQIHYMRHSVITGKKINANMAHFIRKLSGIEFSSSWLTNQLDMFTKNGVCQMLGLAFIKINEFVRDFFWYMSQMLLNWFRYLLSHRFGKNKLFHQLLLNYFYILQLCLSLFCTVFMLKYLRLRALKHLQINGTECVIEPNGRVLLLYIIA